MKKRRSPEVVYLTAASANPIEQGSHDKGRLQREGTSPFPRRYALQTYSLPDFAKLLYL